MQVHHERLQMAPSLVHGYVRSLTLTRRWNTATPRAVYIGTIQASDGVYGTSLMNSKVHENVPWILRHGVSTNPGSVVTT